MGIFQNRWDVLIVDDEPDILSSTKLAIKNVRVYGLPLNIVACASKAEAIEYLESHGEFKMALAIIDVIMETPEAGLELCQFIRDDMKNRISQIVVRTGQAGLVPEKAVIDRYDINMYLTKTDATEDKLYCIVKSSIRQYLWSRTAMFNLWHTHDLVSSTSSEEALVAALDHPQRLTDRTGKLVTGMEPHWAYFLNDRFLVGSGKYGVEADARATRDRLQKQRSTPLVEALDVGDEESDSYVIDGTDLFMRLVATDGLPELHFIVNGEFDLPGFLIDMLYARFRSTRILWNLVERAKTSSGSSS